MRCCSNWMGHLFRYYGLIFLMEVLDMFRELSVQEMENVDGGIDGEYILAGITFAALGVGCLAIATVPGLNVLAAAGVAYVGTWGVSGGIASVAYGCVA